MDKRAGVPIPATGDRPATLTGRLQVAAPVAGFIAAVALAAGMVVARGVSQPWWLTADADAVYTTSGLNLLLGNHTFYLDHPGLPTEEALEAGFGAQYLAEKATGDRTGGVQAFADHIFLNLDRARPVYRSLAVAFYLLGVALAFLLVTRLLGHWTWGFAASLLWLAAPGLIPIAVQIRPDALLCALVLLTTYLIAKAAERRDAWLFVLAGVTVGFAVTVKLHAAGLVPVLLAAVVWRHPAPGWESAIRESVPLAWRRHKRWAIPLSLLVVGSAVAFNLDRPAFTVTHQQETLVFTILALVGGFGACALVARRLELPGAQRLFDPLVAIVAVAVLIGLAIPIVFDPEDGLQMLVSIKDTLSGHGVNQGIAAFSQLNRGYWSFPVFEGLLVFAAAMLATLLGLVRRDPVPVVFGFASAVLVTMALARYDQTYYLAPGYVAAIPAALWLFRLPRNRALPFFVWPLIAIVVVPQFQHLIVHETAPSAQAQAATLTRTLAPVLKPGIVVLTPIQVPDTAFDMAQFYGSYTPQYPYQFVSPWPPFIQLLEGRGLKVRYYAGPQASQVKGEADINLAGLGTFHVRRVAGLDGPGFGVLEILRAPPGL